MSAYTDLDTLRFILFDVLNVEQVCGYDRYKDYDKENFEMLIQATKDFSDKALYPTFREMDSHAAHYKDGKIIVHPVVGEAMKYFGENGGIGAYMDYDHGGMQLPHVVYSALSHIIQCANNHIPGYTGLTAGAANLICSFGTDALREKYVPKMLAGEWGGTMCLTEPQAGSSLSDITTSADPQEDGSYKIKGQKIFISGGDHEYCDNFIHLVLGRIKGAPEGTKGISLFVVPKHRITDDNQLEANDVITAGDFQKMGQKGYCTTHLAFGESDDCQGWLVGAEHKGLRYMFQMMNGARIDVGLTAASTATAAYHASLQYAKERPQGRRITSGGSKDNRAPQTTIINHPDVRRMLLLQKAVVEGSLSLLLEASQFEDHHVAGPEEEKNNSKLLLEILTPIAKTYPSEMGRLSISNGLQIFGGYGFCTDFPLEQYYRDIRIMALYEGTTGIQSLDLLGRKVVMNNGEALQLLKTRVNKIIEKASAYDNLKTYAHTLTDAIKDLETSLGHLLSFAMQGQNERYISDATIFMELMSTVVIGWQWLKMAVTAQKCLDDENTIYGKQFYKNKITTMQFFFKYELTKVKGLKEVLLHEDSITILEDNPEIFA